MFLGLTSSAFSELCFFVDIIAPINPNLNLKKMDEILNSNDQTTQLDLSCQNITSLMQLVAG